MENTDNIKNAIKKIADESWSLRKCPVLLSSLAPLLQKEVSDYKAILQGVSLKEFINKSAGEFGYKLNEHPVQKAKVGIIPTKEKYVYDISQETLPNTFLDSKKREEILISFFKSLATLSKEDVEKVNIPASVIVKLLK